MIGGFSICLPSMDENGISKRPLPQILQPILTQSAQRHQHLCPRQVLGARLGLAALRHLGFTDGMYKPRFVNDEKRLLTIVETDGCGADGVAVATDCHVGRRTLRVLDFGKVAATLVDTFNNRAVRVWPHSQARHHAETAVPHAESKWHAYLEAYQILPDHKLLRIQPVTLTQSLEEILSKPNIRAICEQCGEEIMNEREVLLHGRTLCRACAGEQYYIEVEANCDSSPNPVR